MLGAALIPGSSYAPVTRFSAVLQHTTQCRESRSGPHPTSILRGRLSDAKVPALELQTYASNSLRKGGVSSAFAHGVPLEAIKRHGGWSSNAVNAYITDPVAQRLAIGRAIYFEPDSEEED